MPYTHYITKPTTITKYKGSKPFRLSADYIYDKNINLVSGNFSIFVDQDLVLLTAQTNTLENGLYLFTGGVLQSYYSTFFNSISKIYAISYKDGIASYLGFFGVNNPLNQLRSITPDQGIIIVCKPQVELPLIWYTYTDDQLPSIRVDEKITRGNLQNLGVTSSGDPGKEKEYSINLYYKTYKPVVITSKIGQSSESKNYVVKVDLVSCPDPEYVDISTRINLSTTDFVSAPELPGGPIQFELSVLAISSKFSTIKENSIVWISSSEYAINDLYTYNGYSLLKKVYNSDYLISSKKYVIEEPQTQITSLPDSFYLNHIFYVSHAGHYDIYFSLIDTITGTIVSTDSYCFDLQEVKLMPTPTPTLTPTPAIHTVEFEDGKYLSVPECESCVKKYLSVAANSLLPDGNYYYEFGVFNKGVHSPRDMDAANGESFEPKIGYLSTGSSSQTFGTYFTTEYKVRTTLYVKLTNLNTNVSATSYLTVAVCDENYCPPDLTPTPTPTNPRFYYPKRTPTLTASPPNA